MIEVSGPGGAVAPSRGRPRPGAPGFAVAAALAADPPATTASSGASSGDAAVAVAVAGLGAMLALQETGETAARDREARRQGLALLAELDALQRGLLRDPGRCGAATPDAAALRRLAVLAEHVPAAADPALAAIIHGIVVRARVELARHAAPPADPDRNAQSRDVSKI